jgi:formate/nitrite transporter FocA (FNT family)
LAALAGGAGRIVASFLFSNGLVLVVVAGAELFTGNIIMVVGLFGGRYKWSKLLKNWGAVYLGNLIGSLAYAYLVWKSGLFGKSGDANTLGLLAASVAEAKVLLPFLANMFLIPVGYLSAGILTITLGNIIGGIFIIVVHPNRLRQLGFMRGRQ